MKNRQTGQNLNQKGIRPSKKRRTETAKRAIKVWKRKGKTIKTTKTIERFWGEKESNRRIVIEEEIRSSNQGKYWIVAKEARAIQVI